jgi:hypothetical protein
MTAFDAIVAENSDLRAKLAAMTADRCKAWKSYVDLADTVCRSSTSVEDACNQARETRQDRYRLAQALAAAREIIGKLPKTADGVTVAPGDSVWHTYRDDIVECYARSLSSEDGRALYGWKAEFRVADCYSTRSAAESAATEKGK